MGHRIPIAILATLLVAALPATARAQAPGIVGLAPHQRPVDAPVLGQFSPDLGWRARTLRGVTEPIPPTLRFIDSHGAWYTPFDRPGMPGRYDLRGWHSPPAR